MDTDKSAAFIEGLREFATFLETHPEIELSSQTYNVYASSKEELVAMARGTSWRKEYIGDYFVLRKDFAGLRLDLYTNRETVCRAVVKGQRVVPAVEAQPERTEDIIEWVCEHESLLATS